MTIKSTLTIEPGLLNQLSKQETNFQKRRSRLFLRFHIISFLVLCFTVHGAWASDENNLQFDQPQVLKTLKSAVEKFDELETVPDKSWFGTDKSDVSEEINEFLDDVIAILDIPELVACDRIIEKSNRPLSRDRIKLPICGKGDSWRRRETPPSQRS